MLALLLGDVRALLGLWWLLWWLRLLRCLRLRLLWWVGVWRRLRRNWPKVLARAKAEDWVHNDREEDRQYAKASRLTKGFSKLECRHNSNVDIDKGHKQQQHPPLGSADDLHQDNSVIDGDKGSPAWLASFGKYSPQRGKHDCHHSKA